MFLALNGLIYFPSLTLISSDLSVSLQSVQLTITSSLVVAGLVPAFTGDMADNLGRRPVYLVMFSLMICANLGIALLPNMNGYIGLLVLRMLQSAGSSGMLGFAYGVLVDIAEVDERGGFVGVLLLMADVAASVGPVVGGGLTQLFGWRAIFWFLVILTGTHFIGMFLFFPETSQTLGNYTIDHKGWGIIYKSVWRIIQDKDRKAGKKLLTQAPRKLRLPNPLACLSILLHSKGSLTVVALNAVNSAVKAAMQAVLGAQCVKIYGLTYLQAGLIYIPSGLGGSLGAYAAGRFVDWNYNQWQAEMMARTGISSFDDKEGPPISATGVELPLERIRLRGLHLLSLFTVLGLVGFGLALEFRAHISIMLVLQLLMGASTAASFTLCGTLLTDLNPTKSATAQAADNMARCTSAAGAVAALQPLFASFRPARACVVYGSVAALCFPLGWLLERMGGSWRSQSAVKNRRMTQTAG
ncbi:MFS general substrate transporter [Naviculisporaceae sp. PSN 640]